MRIFLILIIALASVKAWSEDSKVVVLTADNFQSLVLDSEDLWMVEFYAPWCGHCKKLAPEFEKAAAALDGMVKLGALDMTEHGEVGAPYNIEGYPTLKFFGSTVKDPVTYEGERKKRGIIDYMLDAAKQLALSRVGQKQTQQTASSDEAVLTDDNFDDLVMRSDEPWFIEFYAPWCKHCKKMAPDWTRLANKLKGVVNVNKVEATTETTLAERFKVDSFPTLLFFPAGQKNDKQVEIYGGDREYQEMLNFAKKRVGGNKKTEQVVVALEELADQGTFSKNCQNKGKQCLISFLPPLQFSSPEERQIYIQIIKDASSESKNKSLNFLWTNGGIFEELESELNILGSSYPATVIIRSDLKKFFIFQGVFQEQQLVEFVNEVSSGKANGFSYEDFPTLKQTAKRDDL